MMTARVIITTLFNPPPYAQKTSLDHHRHPATFEVMPLDLADFRSVRAFAE
jgi:hypothetical protein